jgi:carnitine O-acetyltransferase
MAGATTWQLRRAAWLIYRTLEFKDNLHTYVPLILFVILSLTYSSQEPLDEMTRTGIWLRESTSKMFNIARIPQPSCDVLSTPPREPHSLAARSILVMFHNFCYTIPVYSPTGDPASPREIYRKLQKVVGDVDERVKSGEQAFPIGILSADDRGIWANVRDISPHPVSPNLPTSVYRISPTYFHFLPRTGHHMTAFSTV